MPPSSPQLTILGATMEGASIRCSCTVEHLKETGEVLRRQPLKAAAIELGRNELRDIVLRLSHAEGKLGPFTLREHTVHRRFVKEGKASIVLKTQGIQILLSNCPPEQLRQFLGHLGVKLTARGRLQGLQKRMVGDVSLQFEEISPLGAKDFDVIKCRDQENISTPTRKLGAPDCKAAKRKLSEANANEGDPPACKVQALSASFGNHPVLGTRQKSPNLSQEQQRVLDAVKKGESVFFTGSAGTGKSWLLKRIIASLPPDTTFPTASTGVAACHIGGKTLHSFAGIGNGTGDLETCIKQASMEPSASQWCRCQCLIIDEISMIDAELFDKLEAIARAVRRSREPFGGIQLVLCGDFLQLPPVSKDAKTKEYCFQAHSWRKSVTQTIELTQVYRQRDTQFIALLQNIRIGRCPPAITELLRNTELAVIEREGVRPTKLCTHNEDVDATNTRELSALTGQLYKFSANDSDLTLSKQLDALCPAPGCIELKVGAQVMLTKNMDVERGLVNGARGVIKGFDSKGKGYPTVHFISGQDVTVGLERWTVHARGGSVVTRRQLPLKLAWAMSIHKSQKSRWRELLRVDKRMLHCHEPGVCRHCV
eukprot:Em0011g76a